MKLKKVILGEEMPDKDDPKYKERYEKEVEAGRKVAKALGIGTLTYRFQMWANRHSKAFFIGVLMLIAFIVLVSLMRLALATKIPTSTTHAVERQEQVLRKTKKFQELERQSRSQPDSHNSHEIEPYSAFR